VARLGAEVMQALAKMGDAHRGVRSGKQREFANNDGEAVDFNPGFARKGHTKGTLAASTRKLAGPSVRTVVASKRFLPLRSKADVSTTTTHRSGVRHGSASGSSSKGTEKEKPGDAGLFLLD
jgi:hypothetical protein